MLQDGLVVMQTSLAVVLLVGAALMIQSTVKLLRVDPGLDPKGLYRAWYDSNPLQEITRPDFETAERRGLTRNEAINEWWPEYVRRHRHWNDLMVERLRSVPGIELAAINGNSMGSFGWADYQLEGRLDLLQLSNSEIGIRSGDYFRTLRLPLIAGRLLTEQDCVPGQQAVVVNLALARRCWPGQSPLGKRLSRGANQDKEEYVVAGVVKDMLDWQKDLPQQPTLYIPVERFTKSVDIGGNFMIRSSLLYGVKPTDPWAFGAVVLTLGVVGSIACWLPARRAARVDPVKALRYE